MNLNKYFAASKLSWIASRMALLAAIIGLGSLSLQPLLASAAGTTDSSLNWAGYTATTGSYTGVSGTWTIPNIADSSALSADATWVGIGGISSNDLIQAGTQAIVQNGTVQYQAWVETLPQVSQTLTLPVKSGDSITASITQQSTGVWLVVLQDNTTNQTYQQTIQYASSLSSVEWIEEMPMSGNILLPLDTFRTVNFTNASAIVGGVRENLIQSGATAISMLNNFNQVLASPSAIGTDNQSFSVTEAVQTASSSSGSGVTVHSYTPGTRVVRGFGRGDRGGNSGSTTSSSTGATSTSTGTTATSTPTSAGSSGAGYSTGSYGYGQNPLSWFLQQWQNQLNSLGSTTSVSTPNSNSGSNSANSGSSQWQQYQVQIPGFGNYTIYIN